MSNPIIDAQMTRDEALDGLNPDCPPEILDKQRLVTVTYWSFDAKVHRGQLVVDEALVDDVQQVFAVALEHRFPIASVIPIAHPRFRKDGVWDDHLSMAANNTSCFNYRSIEGGRKLSNHAMGRAIDINPVQNPYVRGEIVLPPGSSYAPVRAGTLHADDPIVRAFTERGWTWGGTWQTLKDYQHFEKPEP